MKYKTTATFSGRRADTGEDVTEPVEIVISTATKASANNRATFEALAWKALRELRPDWVPADHTEGLLFLPSMGLWKIRPIVSLSGSYEKISMPRAAKKAIAKPSAMEIAEKARQDADVVIARALEIMAATKAAGPDVTPGQPRNTALTICYRDSDNYKADTGAVVSGLITQSHIDAIRSHLSDGEFFIAHQVGLPTPSEQFAGKDGYPNDDCDHVFSTLFDDDTRPEDLHTDAAPTMDMSIDELVEMFRSINRWDEAAEWKRLKSLDQPGSGKPAPKA